MSCCPTCGQTVPRPATRPRSRRPALTDRRCDHCGTQLGEIHFSVQANAWACIRCYLNGVEQILQAAA